MQCWICKRQARGLIHTDSRHGVSDPRRYPTDWAFCSRRCQSAFHLFYGRWVEAAQLSEDATMVDATQVEQAAIKQCLKFFGEAAAEIGFDKPLGSYSKDEALRVVEAIVTGYCEAMAVHHEQTRHACVQGLGANGAEVRDPIRSPPLETSPATSTAFDDMPSDAPWEAGHA